MHHCSLCVLMWGISSSSSCSINSQPWQPSFNPDRGVMVCILMWNMCKLLFRIWDAQSFFLKNVPYKIWDCLIYFTPIESFSFRTVLSFMLSTPVGLPLTCIIFNSCVLLGGNVANMLLCVPTCNLLTWLPARFLNGVSGMRSLHMQRL